MRRSSRSMALALASVIWCGVSASAETLRCQSINGNLNCSGSSGVSCQTINGKTVCTSGDGRAVQSFGAAPPTHVAPDPGDSMGPDDDGSDDLPPDRPQSEHLQMHGPSGHTLLLDRTGGSLHLRTNWMSLDRN